MCRNAIELEVKTFNFWRQVIPFMGAIMILLQEID